MKILDEPGLNITEVFKKVKQEVYAESRETQLPSVEDNSIGGDFYFTKGESNSKAEAVNHPAATVKVTTTTATFDYGYGPSDAATVTVGQQTWISKNLNTDHFANGDPIPEARTPEEWKAANDNGAPAWCYYNNDLASGRTYGKLYNWYAVNDPRGLAPRGWHVPSDAEWTAITDYLGGATIAGTSLKSTSLWADYNSASVKGNNSSGVACLPGGSRYSGGTFNYIGKYGDWWSSSEYTTGRAWSRGLSYSSGDAGRQDDAKGDGYSVRCLRD